MDKGRAEHPQPTFAAATVPGLSPAVLRALRGALEDRPGAPPSDGELRRAMRLVCDDARHRGLRAEQLIITFKQVWATLPEVRKVPRGAEREEMLARLVSMCINEFYAEPHDNAE